MPRPVSAWQVRGALINICFYMHAASKTAAAAAAAAAAPAGLLGALGGRRCLGPTLFFTLFGTVTARTYIMSRQFSASSR